MDYVVGEYIFWKQYRVIDGSNIQREYVYCLITSEDKWDEQPEGTIFESQLNILHRKAPSKVYHGHRAVKHEVKYMLDRSRKVTFS